MTDTPRYTLPPGCCDTHIHIYDERFPPAPTAIAAPPKGGVEEYRALQRRLGLDRAVVVQPSAYGTDNRCTLDAIAALGPGRTRGIAVVDRDVSDRELEELSRRGIVGARFLMIPGGAIGWEQLDIIAARVAEHGWHVQLQLDGRDLPRRIEQVLAWPGRIVVDHVGKFLEPVSVSDPAFRCLLDLVETGRVWVKLSAPYEVSRAGPPLYEDVGALAKALVRAAPDRMLWASNWPHPSAEEPPDDAALLDLLLEWADDEDARRAIMVENPAALYRFA